MPAHRSETGSSMVNKQRELYGKGKECRNVLQGQLSLMNAISSVFPNMTMKMF